jgi:hypothetical protein
VTTEGPSQLFISELVDALRRSKARYYNTADPKEKRAEWEAQIKALLALAYKFDPCAEETLLLPLNDLLLAFLSLDVGRTEPPLRVQKVNNRPRSVREAVFRGYAAAASSAVVRVGVPTLLADTQVAESLNALGYRREATQGSITAATIASWRKEAREGAPDDVMRSVHDQWLKSKYLEELAFGLAGVIDFTGAPGIQWSDTPGPEDVFDVPELRGMIECLATITTMRVLFPPAAAPLVEK